MKMHTELFDWIHYLGDVMFGFQSGTFQQSTPVGCVLCWNCYLKSKILLVNVCYENYVYTGVYVVVQFSAIFVLFSGKVVMYDNK